MFLRYVLWADNSFCLHKTSSRMYHWSPLTRDGREHPEIQILFPLTVSYLSAVSGQRSWLIPTHLITSTHWSYHYLLAWLLPPHLITTYSNQLPILRHVHPAPPKSPVPNLDMLHKKAQGCVMSMEDVLHNQVHHRGVLSSGLPPPLPFAKVPTISGPVFHYHGRWDSPPLFICHVAR